MKSCGPSVTKEDQNDRYLKLLGEIRKDLKIDDGDISKFPNIGLVDIVQK